MGRIMTTAQVAAHQAMYGRDRDRTAPAPTNPPAGLHITVPMPPSVNALYGVDSKGQKFLLPEQVAFRKEVEGLVHIATRGNIAPMAGRIHLWLRLHFANRRRTDISNRIKALEDSFTHAGVYKDDSQIDKLDVERVVDPGGPEFCTAEVREMA